MQYIKFKDLGFDTDKLVAVQLYGDIRREFIRNTDAVKAELLKYSGISNIAMASNMPGERFSVENLRPDGIPDDEDSCPLQDATGLDSNDDGCIDSIENLAQVLEALPEGSISEEIENSLISKVENALKSLDKDVINAGINKLEAFINEIEAQRDKNIS